MVREDLVNGALSFLQDPTVASAPLEQRIAFLRSKNLTQEEIDLSLQRAGSEPSGAAGTPQNYPYQQPSSYRQPPPPNYGNYQNGYWQPPPPEIPRRDWRDWFIMATVVGGVSYGVYTLTKRYVYPLIAPPTPPQLEQDKASIDTSFEKAFALLDQVAADTEELKASEKTRTERLDAALSEVEAVIGNMKDASRRRDDESRRLGDEVRSLRDLVPKAIKTQEESADMRLKELGAEMKSLKTLLSNRIAAPRSATTPSFYGNSQPTPSTNGASTNGPSTNGASAPANPTLVQESKDMATGDGQQGDAVPASFPVPPQEPQVPDRSANSSPYSRMMNGRAAIPAWQMAASKKSQEPKQDTTESGTAVDGASA